MVEQLDSGIQRGLRFGAEGSLLMEKRSSMTIEEVITHASRPKGPPNSLTPGVYVSSQCAIVNSFTAAPHDIASKSLHNR